MRVKAFPLPLSRGRDWPGRLRFRPLAGAPSGGKDVTARPLVKGVKLIIGQKDIRLYTNYTKEISGDFVKISSAALGCIFIATFVLLTVILFSTPRRGAAARN